MIAFEGTYFDGISSKAHPVTAVCSSGFLSLRGEEDGLSLDLKLADVSLTPPLGTTRRVLELPGGARCETPDLNAVLQLERLQGEQVPQRHWAMQWVHVLESRWRLVLACAVCLLLCLWGLVAYGIPWLAERAASATPPLLANTISEQSLAVLDKRFFKPSRLDPARIDNLQQQFQTLIQDSSLSVNAQLIFRRSPAIGANALALPSGVVIMTDELVRLAQDDRELQGIMAHELAHVIQQHGLRNTYQSAGIFLLIAMLTGDVVSLTSIASGLPTLLIETGYARQFETAADTFAAQYMLKQGWGTQPLRDILQRLSRPQDQGLPSFLSTHPGTAERIKHLEAMERNF